jgi:hypothetical protein
MRRLRLNAPALLVMLILPIALLALTIILIIDMLAWLVMAPIRLAAIAVRSQATLTVHYDAAGQPIDCDWHLGPKR